MTDDYGDIPMSNQEPNDSAPEGEPRYVFVSHARSDDPVENERLQKEAVVKLYINSLLGVGDAAVPA